MGAANRTEHTQNESKTKKTRTRIQGPDGRKLPGLTNLGMGYVFEELIRKFNEENNEEAGEHFTPREVIQLMVHLLFEPVKKKLPPVITIYDITNTFSRFGGRSATFPVCSAEIPPLTSRPSD